MEIIYVKIYIRKRIRKLCELVFQNREKLNEFIKDLDNLEKGNCIYLNKIVFSKREFRYMKIKYKKVI